VEAETTTGTGSMDQRNKPTNHPVSILLLNVLSILTACVVCTHRGSHASTLSAGGRRSHYRPDSRRRGLACLPVYLSILIHSCWYLSRLVNSSSLDPFKSRLLLSLLLLAAAWLCGPCGALPLFWFRCSVMNTSLNGD